MPNLASSTCCSMINLAIDHHTSTDTPSQANIQCYAFSHSDTTYHLCQCSCICIVINYTRDSKSFGKIVLQREIIPPMRVMERTDHPMLGIHQTTDRDADT